MAYAVSNILNIENVQYVAVHATFLHEGEPFSMISERITLGILYVCVAEVDDVLNKLISFKQEEQFCLCGFVLSFFWETSAPSDCGKFMD